MRRTVYVVVPLIGAAALAGYAYYANRNPSDASPIQSAGQAAGKSAAPGPGAVTVEATTVTLATVKEDVTAVGTLRSNESVVVRPEISGRISVLNFTEGAAVTKGQLLVALDASVPAAEVQQAKANLALARSNFDRTVELERNKFVSQNAKDQALNNLRVAEAALALAVARLAKTEIRAPFAGVIGIRQVSVGDYAKEGQDLVTLEDISSLKVDFRVPELLLTSLRRGQTVEVETDAVPGKTFAATLDAIDPLVDQNGRALSIRARLTNIGGILRPGMFVRTKVILAERPNSITVPEESLVPVGSEQYIYRVADGKAQRVKVVTGMRRAGQVEVVEGLRPGDMVVTAGQLKLRDGAAVQIAGAANRNAPKADTPTAGNGAAARKGG